MTQRPGEIVRDFVPEHVGNGFARDPGHSVHGEQQQQLRVADLQQLVAMPHLARSEASDANRRRAQLPQACEVQLGMAAAGASA